MARKPARLRALKISEVSLVDRPANPGATVLLAKRDSDEPIADEEGLISKIAGILGLVQPGTHSPAGAPGTPNNVEDEPMAKTAEEIAALEKRNQELEALVAKNSAEPTEEELLKRLPVSVKKQLEEAEELKKTVAKMAETAADNAMTDVAKSMIGNAPVKVDDLKVVLKQLNDAGQAVVKELFAKYNAVLKSSGLFEERGSDAAETLSKQDALSKAAADIRKADPKVSVQKSIAMALEADPSLYTG